MNIRRGYYQNQDRNKSRINSRFVNTVGEDYINDYIQKGDRVYYFDEETNSYQEGTPNDEAPTEVEIVGAMI